MPLYEYRCNECGAEFEKIVRFSETCLLPACPECQGQDTRKKISTIAFLNGSGSGSKASTNASCSPRGGFS